MRVNTGTQGCLQNPYSVDYFFKKCFNGKLRKKGACQRIRKEEPQFQEELKGTETGVWGRTKKRNARVEGTGESGRHQGPRLSGGQVLRPGASAHSAIGCHRNAPAACFSRGTTSSHPRPRASYLPAARTERRTALPTPPVKGTPAVTSLEEGL